MLSKIEISIDFKLPEGQVYHSNTQKQKGEPFTKFTKLFHDYCQQFAVYFISFAQAAGTATLIATFNADKLEMIVL